MLILPAYSPSILTLDLFKDMEVALIKLCVCPYFEITRLLPFSEVYIGEFPFPFPWGASSQGILLCPCFHTLPCHPNSTMPGMLLGKSGSMTQRAPQGLSGSGGRDKVWGEKMGDASISTFWILPSSIYVFRRHVLGTYSVPRTILDTWDIKMIKI